MENEMKNNEIKNEVTATENIIPFSVTLNDYKTKIYSAINECNLHPSIVKMVIENLYKEISVTANEFEKKEIEDYNNKK